MPWCSGYQIHEGGESRHVPRHRGLGEIAGLLLDQDRAPRRAEGAGSDPRLAQAYNVWSDASCSATDLKTPNLGFVEATPGAFDLHLRATSAAVDRGDPSSYPAGDIDGESRPLGAAPDAGADERQ
jgi:hypothetical protein